MAELITVEEAKAHLRVDSDDENGLIGDIIVDARGWIESYTGLILTRRSVKEVLPRFTSRLRSWPIETIDAVAYIDASGAVQALDAALYVPQVTARPAALLGRRWPNLYHGSRVTVELTAGFASAQEVKDFSPNLMRAMKLLIAGFYHDRETGGLTADVEESAKALCRNLKDWRV